MRSHRWAAAAVAATALAVVPAATAGMMHPELGAHLSGMGETGIVNLTAHSTGHTLCWKFQLHLMHPLSATVRDKAGMTVAHLGHMYSAKGCATVPKQALDSLETTPSHFWVWVATKGHPGELRGKLFAGMAHM